MPDLPPKAINGARERGNSLPPRVPGTWVAQFRRKRLDKRSVVVRRLSRFVDHGKPTPTPPSMSSDSA